MLISSSKCFGVSVFSCTANVLWQLHEITSGFYKCMYKGIRRAMHVTCSLESRNNNESLQFRSWQGYKELLFDLHTGMLDLTATQVVLYYSVRCETFYDLWLTGIMWRRDRTHRCTCLYHTQRMHLDVIVTMTQWNQSMHKIPDKRYRNPIIWLWNPLTQNTTGMIAFCKWTH